MARPRRPKAKESGRRTKKKVSILNTESIDYVDWKDVNLLRRFQSDRAKIRARRVTGNSTQQQRQVALAIRNAREMALLPYTNRVTTHRGGGGGRGRDRDGERGDRGDRGDRPDRGDREAAPPTDDAVAADAPASTEEVSS
jgi:small subunit ribosomal protein S18